MRITPDQFLDYLFGKTTADVQSRIAEAVGKLPRDLPALVSRVVEALQTIHGASATLSDLHPSQIRFEPTTGVDSVSPIVVDFLAVRRGIADPQQISRVNEALVSQDSELRRAMQGVQKLAASASSGADQGKRPDYWDRRRRWLLDQHEMSAGSRSSADGSTEPIQSEDPNSSEATQIAPLTGQYDQLIKTIQRIIDTADALGRSGSEGGRPETASGNAASAQELWSNPSSWSLDRVPTANDEVVIAAVTLGFTLAQLLDNPTAELEGDSQHPPS
jgi:hypothetical protein